ncbi:methylase involved in ubiquinone/menaquinone biosynthesis [Candidatus Nitrososphaera evergladensis SR1]|jgi:ubiquinone/menaquinone biosynthesis C-methylase UbiE|uniref:Methylase involved in ubiquinone/menaquinone biosynthesis n=1 Tax=Candidatus Nitrososphaera evergladensis SR1 TaxID=1459636 RepID=A0A075MTG6_9ARCH|nr:methyltransferase domain-containing protein [Candidatus Nitrososphaera evergladensis]AIF84901.1 methylase involved in ubiquinone/menaquinone biosynthesis [Candidatus Nitrososphaera evergladensis SR1]
MGAKQIDHDDDDKSHNASIISQFTKNAAHYHQLSEHSNQHGKELMLKLSKPQPDDTVLDVACGTGIVSCEFAQFVSHVTGIDLTPAMIEQAKQAQQEKQLKNITWKIGDVSKPLPFDDSSFSMVVTRYSFHHLLEPKKVLQEMERVCASKGKILVIDVTPDPDKVDAYNRVEKLRDSSHVGALTLTELENIMREAGLTDIEIEHHDLEVELESILQASSPSQNDADKIRLLFKQDLTKDNLGMRSHLKENKIHFYFPISMIVGKKN